MTELRSDPARCCAGAARRPGGGEIDEEGELLHLGSCSGKEAGEADLYEIEGIELVENLCEISLE